MCIRDRFCIMTKPSMGNVSVSPKKRIIRMKQGKNDMFPNIMYALLSKK